MSATVSRRRAIGLGITAAAAAAAGTAGWLAFSSGPGRFQPVAGQPLGQPELLDSVGGRLHVDLTAGSGAAIAGHPAAGYGYNGGSPGPTLRVRPGDELTVRLTNRLSRPTNLHTHGLRVSAQGNADNPFVRVDPGASFDYRYLVPADHPAGTDWYHPHHHGMVADQLFAGLVGALLVDGGEELDVDADLVMLVTDTTLDDAGGIVWPTAAQRRMGRLGELVLVNGQYQPTVAATPGSAQRWRIVNACTSRFLALRLRDHQLTQVALDGTYLPAPLARDVLVLAPGNRADVVVRPRGTGRFALVTEGVNRTMTGGATSGTVTLATMVSAGAARPSPELPAALPAEAALTTAASATRRIALRMGGMSGGGMGGRPGMDAGGMTPTIDGRTFDQDRTDQRVRLGTVEEWTVTNSGPLDHPFHLHVWPFTVLAVSDGSPVTGTRQDVVTVPAGGWVRLRIPFTTLPGRTVYHCHILDHEDAGMMGVIEVGGDAVP